MFNCTLDVGLHLLWEQDLSSYQVQSYRNKKYKSPNGSLRMMVKWSQSLSQLLNPRCRYLFLLGVQGHRDISESVCVLHSEGWHPLLSRLLLSWPQLSLQEVMSMCDWMADSDGILWVKNVRSLVMGPLPQLLCYEMGPLVRLYIIKDAIPLDQKF